MLRMILGLILTLLLATATAAEQASPAVPVYTPPPTPGQLVDLGGRRLHLLCAGVAEGPAVIFEAGLSQYSAYSTYTKAQDAIAPFARWAGPVVMGILATGRSSWSAAGAPAGHRATSTFAGVRRRKRCPPCPPTAC
jgi:hypothetical protein